MNTSFSLLLLAALVCFLCVTNPTGEEFSSWYVQQSLAGAPDPVFDEVSDAFCEHLNETAQRRDYLLCSVFSYEGRQTLGIGLMFFPVDSLSAQAENLRADYADWLDVNAG